MSAAAGRPGAASRWDIRGRRSRSADPAATIGQAWPGLPVFSFGLIAQGQSRVRQRLSRGRATCDDGLGDQYLAMQGVAVAV